MKEYKLISWNVNGIRATLKKGFWDLLSHLNPDIIAIQEIKADDSVIESGILNKEKYYLYWHSSTIKKGYSGTATLSLIPALSFQKGLGLEKFDCEGRVTITKFEDFTLLNIYFPNGGQGKHRVLYKLEFYDFCLNFMETLRKNGENLVICGDYNTAHNEIDLHDPENNHKSSGFLPIERAWLNKLVEYNYIDTYRYLNPNKADIYTWWDMKTRARERNKGWRIDYFFIPKEMLPNLKSADIHDNIIGSDHCPISLDLVF